MFCLGAGLKVLGAVPASVLFLSDPVDIVANEFSYIHTQSVGLLGQTYLSPFLRLPDCENPIPAACRIEECQCCSHLREQLPFSIKPASIQQFASLDLERLGQFLDNLDCRIARRAFQITDIGPVNASPVSIFLLAPAIQSTQAAQICSKALTNIHLAIETPMQFISLQTISDNRLDFTGEDCAYCDVTHRMQGCKPMNINRKAYVTAVLLAAAIASPQAAAQSSGETARTAKEQQKRLSKLSSLNAAHFENTAKVKGDAFEPNITILTDEGFKFKGGFTSTVRSDNFVRAIIGKSTGRTIWQIYQTVTYSSGWRMFDSVNLKIGDQLVSRKLDIISRDVVTCSYGPCVHSEILGIPLEEAEVEALIASSSTGLLQFRLKSRNGLDWDDDIAIAEIVGAYRKVSDYRDSLGGD